MCVIEAYHYIISELFELMLYLLFDVSKVQSISIILAMKYICLYIRFIIIATQIILYTYYDIGLSVANALEIPQTCTKQSMWYDIVSKVFFSKILAGHAI